MNESTLKSGISIHNLCYYFDGVERERLDTGALNRKSGEWLAMRTKLVQLPDATFEVVMRSISSFVDSVAPASTSPSTPAAKRADRDRALALFEKVVQSEKGGHSTRSALEKAAAV